jgi:hypothetical protein
MKTDCGIESCVERIHGLYDGPWLEIVAQVSSEVMLLGRRSIQRYLKGDIHERSDSQSNR